MWKPMVFISVAYLGAFAFISAASEETQQSHSSTTSNTATRTMSITSTRAQDQAEIQTSKATDKSISLDANEQPKIASRPSKKQPLNSRKRQFSCPSSASQVFFINNLACPTIPLYESPKKHHQQKQSKNIKQSTESSETRKPKTEKIADVKDTKEHFKIPHLNTKLDESVKKESNEEKKDKKMNDIFEGSFEKWMSEQVKNAERSQKENKSPDIPKDTSAPPADANAKSPKNSQDSTSPSSTNNTNFTESTPLKNPIIHPRLHANSKDRFNFASFDCGSIIRSSNPESKSATAILSSNKDAYMLNQCKANQFVVVELCEEILVDTIVLANLELFSSMFKDIRVSISNEYPPTRARSDNQNGNGWTVLAHLLARNVRSEQHFVIPNPVMWTKYIKLDFITHYGSEFYCPITLLRVFGKTVMEDLRVESNNNGKQAMKQDQEEFDNLRKEKRKRVPTTSSLTPFTSPLLDIDKDINEWLENFVFPYTEYIPKTASGAGTANVGPETDDSKDSVLKSILKRIARLEQNMTISHAYLSLQHKKLQEIYLNLDTSIHTRVDIFLQRLTEQVVDGMQSITAEYENVLDSWISDLTVVKRQIKQDVQFLKTRVQFLMIIVILLCFIVVVYIMLRIRRVRHLIYALIGSKASSTSISDVSNNEQNQLKPRSSLYSKRKSNSGNGSRSQLIKPLKVDTINILERGQMSAGTSRALNEQQLKSPTQIQKYRMGSVKFDKLVLSVRKKNKRKRRNSL